MESLSRFIHQAVNDKKWTPIKISTSSPTSSHFIFADDLVIFTKANMENANTITSVFQKFDKILCQKINYNKSKVIFSNNVASDIFTPIVNQLNMKTLANFGKYLGLPMTKTQPNKNNYQFIIDNMNNRLKGLKEKMLNIAGRTILVKSIFVAIPTYQ